MPQGLKPSKKGFIAALKALRHPKPSSSSADCKAGLRLPSYTARLKRLQKNSHSALERLKA
jgi:hypothetical protein